MMDRASSPTPWRVEPDEAGWAASIRAADGHFIASVGYYTETERRDAAVIAAAPEALAILALIVREEEIRYEREYRAASAHNNADGAGVHFDYAPYPTHPEWFDEAQDIIVKAKTPEE